MKKDWHKTQNEEYLSLLSNRLKEEKLIWVKQFTKIINELIITEQLEKIDINDIGCNVGHFYRAIPDIRAVVNYAGYDISQTYLDIAKNNFNADCFYLIDISSEPIRECEITVVSATLEHIREHEKALKNILEKTKKFLIIRTFIGETFLEEYCKKNGAEESYLIKQFTLEHIKKICEENKFVVKSILEDHATNSKELCVCEGNIPRTQKVLLLSHV